MNDYLGRIRARVTELFNGFTTGQKAITGLAVVVVIAGAFLFTGWAS